MKNTIFKGMATALVTPMTPHGVDYDALGRLIDFQIEQGIDALVSVGTTGESATLSDRERTQVIAFTVQQVNGRVPVIGGTGTNETSRAVELTKRACDVGVDGILAVTPYYNKATQKGLIAHYTAIADAADKPVITYCVPSRTGCNILPDTLAVMGQHPNIAALKDASGNMDQTVETIAKCGHLLDIYSGEDSLTVPMMAMGALGCISVVSNVVPGRAAQMCKQFFAGDIPGAANLQCALLPLIRALFSEVNPIPAKAAVSAMGFGEEYLRMPLTPMEPGNRENLLKQMKLLGVKLCE